MITLLDQTKSGRVWLLHRPTHAEVLQCFGLVPFGTAVEAGQLRRLLPERAAGSIGGSLKWLTNHGYLERLQPRWYRLTPKGLDAFGEEDDAA